METPRSLAQTAWLRARAVWPVLLMTGLLASALVVGVGLLARRAGIGFSDLSRDTAWIAGVPFYVGALSSIGILVWWGGGFVALAAASVLRRRGRTDRLVRFLRASGLLTLWLALDDLLQIHEVVVPSTTGINERWVVGVYVLALAWYAAAFRRLILRTDFPLLVAAGACFAVSVAVDALIPRMPLQHIIEDGGKLVGIAFWTVYLTRTSIAAVQRVDADARDEPSAQAADAAADPLAAARP